MTTKSALSVLALSCVALGASAGPAVAATQSASMTVSATVIAGCGVSVAMAFPSDRAAATKAAAGVSVICNNSVPYTVSVERRTIAGLFTRPGGDDFLFRNFGQCTGPKHHTRRHPPRRNAFRHSGGIHPRRLQFAGDPKPSVGSAAPVARRARRCADSHYRVLTVAPLSGFARETAGRIPATFVEHRRNANVGQWPRNRSFGSPAPLCTAWIHMAHSNPRKCHWIGHLAIVSSDYKPAPIRLTWHRHRDSSPFDLAGCYCAVCYERKGVSGPCSE